MLESYDGLGKPFPKSLHQVAKGIRLLVLDIDGVLTDGRLYYGAEGEVLKGFNVKDGVGIKLLRTQGIEVAVISAKSSMPLQKRMTDLGIQHFFPGTKDKKAQLIALSQNLSLSSDKVAFVGDDVIDMNVMDDVGLFIAPADAHPIVKQKAHHVTELAGGKGVAREVADALLSTQMSLEQAYQVGRQPEFEEQDYLNKSKQ